MVSSFVLLSGLKRVFLTNLSIESIVRFRNESYVPCEWFVPVLYIYVLVITSRTPIYVDSRYLCVVDSMH